MQFKKDYIAKDIQEMSGEYPEMNLLLQQNTSEPRI